MHLLTTEFDCSVVTLYSRQEVKIQSLSNHFISAFLSYIMLCFSHVHDLPSDSKQNVFL